jgi:hypothetical protein
MAILERMRERQQADAGGIPGAASAAGETANNDPVSLANRSSGSADTTVSDHFDERAAAGGGGQGDGTLVTEEKTPMRAPADDSTVTGETLLEQGGIDAGGSSGPTTSLGKGGGAVEMDPEERAGLASKIAEQNNPQQEGWLQARNTWTKMLGGEIAGIGEGGMELTEGPSNDPGQYSEARGQWADIMSTADDGLEHQLNAIDADTSRLMRRASEMGSGMVGGAHIGAMGQAGLSGAVAKGQAIADNNKQKLELKMGWLDQLMRSAEAENNRELQMQIQNEITKTQMDLKRLDMEQQTAKETAAMDTGMSGADYNTPNEIASRFSNESGNMVPNEVSPDSPNVWDHHSAEEYEKAAKAKWPQVDEAGVNNAINQAMAHLPPNMQEQAARIAWYLYTKYASVDGNAILNEMKGINTTAGERDHYQWPGGSMSSNKGWSESSGVTLD